MSDKFDFETPNYQPSYSPINFEIPRTIKKKKSLKGYLFAGFIGGLIGALLVSIIFMGYFGVNFANFKNDVNSAISGLNLESSNNLEPVTRTVVLNSGNDSFVTDVAKKLVRQLLESRTKAQPTTGGLMRRKKLQLVRAQVLL